MLARSLASLAPNGAACWSLAVLLLLGVLGAGCKALEAPEADPVPTLARPLWSPEFLDEHLRFLNGPDTDSRATSTLGFATAAAYVAARFEQYRLQPALAGDYRVVYQAPVNQPRQARLLVSGLNDTLAFLPGLDFIPDARTDATRLTTRDVVVGPARQGRLAAPVVMRRGPVPTDTLRALQARGAEAVLLVGRLAPDRAAEAVPGLGVLQVRPQLAATLLGVPIERLPGLLDTPRRWRLPRALELSVVVDQQPRAGAINTMGYIAGRRPEVRSELVIVCADLDAVGSVAGVPTLDVEHFGLGAAAVLEMTRNLAYVTQYRSVPERSVLVALWSGARTGHQGLQAYLRRPTWDLSKARAVVYVGLDEEEEPAVRALLADYGLPLYAVPVPDSLRLTGRVLLQPDALARRAYRLRTGEVPPAAELDQSALYAQAVEAAQALGQRAYEVVLGLATTDAPLLNLPDTLATPPGL